MKPEQEIIAKALEIAITLTGADHTWLRVDADRNIRMDEPLLSTVRNVVKILNDVTLTAISGNPTVICGSRRPDKSKM
jgi:hypothetical protein